MKMHFKENSVSDVSLSCMSQKREKHEMFFPIMETTLQWSILTTSDNAWKRGPDSKEKAWTNITSQVPFLHNMSFNQCALPRRLFSTQFVSFFFCYCCLLATFHFYFRLTAKLPEATAKLSNVGDSQKRYKNTCGCYFSICEVNVQHLHYKVWLQFILTMLYQKCISKHDEEAIDSNM